MNDCEVDNCVLLINEQFVFLYREVLEIFRHWCLRIDNVFKKTLWQRGLFHHCFRIASVKLMFNRAKLKTTIWRSTEVKKQSLVIERLENSAALKLEWNDIWSLENRVTNEARKIQKFESKKSEKNNVDWIVKWLKKFKKMKTETVEIDFCKTQKNRRFWKVKWKMKLDFWSQKIESLSCQINQFDLSRWDLLCFSSKLRRLM